MWTRRDLPELAKLWQQGDQDAESERLSSQQSQQAQQFAKLQDYLKGQTESNRQEQGKQLLNDPAIQGVVNNGGSYSVNPESGAVNIGGNPYAKLAGQGPHEAKTYQGIVEKTFKPINDVLDASKSTLDNLNQGNSTGDQLALINEARLGLAGSGGRAIGQVLSHLSGDPTMAQDSQKAINWLQNTPNLPTMQPAQRNAIRESVFNRLDQTEQQGTQAAQNLAAQGPALAPHTDFNSILGAYTNPAQQKLQGLRKMQTDYQGQRQQMAPQPPVSQPSQASPNPTTFDKLKSFFTGGGSAQPQAQQAQQPQQAAPVDPLDAAISSALQKKAAKALQTQTSQQQQPGVGQ